MHNILANVNDFIIYYRPFGNLSIGILASTSALTSASASALQILNYLSKP